MIEIPLYSKTYINYVVNFFLEGLDYIVSQGAPPPLPKSQVMYTKHCTRKRGTFNSLLLFYVYNS